MTKRDKVRRLVVPIVLAVSIVGTAIAVSSTTGCGGDKRKLDAGIGDGGVDTPIV